MLLRSRCSAGGEADTASDADGSAAESSDESDAVDDGESGASEESEGDESGSDEEAEKLPPRPSWNGVPPVVIVGFPYSRAMVETALEHFQGPFGRNAEYVDVEFMFCNCKGISLTSLHAPCLRKVRDAVHPQMMMQTCDFQH